jgi:DNA-binding response OmpR family regulator
MISRTPKPYRFRPRMVVAYAESSHAALSARHFRRLGWEVHLANSGANARRLTHALAPEVVILDTQVPDDNGWWTCAKVLLANGARRLVLVSPTVTPEEVRLAKSVGAAAVIGRDNEVARLADEIA